MSDAFYSKLPDEGAGHVNIFQFDAEPEAAARQHCDVHVVKMILETAQILSTAWHVLCSQQFRVLDAPEESEFGGVLYTKCMAYAAKGAPRELVGEADGPIFSGDNVYLLFGQRIYAPTHVNHPCTIWARTSAGNYKWLWRLGMALCTEYTYRFGKTHKTEAVLWTLEPLPPPLEGSAEDWNWLSPCMPPEYKVLDTAGCYDTPASYIRYCSVAKRHILEWTRREDPIWAPPF
jgi:hypothetical protein